MLVLGLTGSAAMGKSTVAAMFAEAGAATFNADAAVHALYRGAAAPRVEAAFPGVTIGGAVDRAKLRDRVVGDDKAITRLEALVHPLVREAEAAFRAEAVAAGRRILVLDIPLLFEVGRAGDVDAVVVVSAPEAVQRQRLRARAGMSDAQIDALLARQVPDAEKRRRAHFIIDTGGQLKATRAAVADLLRAVAGMAGS